MPVANAHSWSCASVILIRQPDEGPRNLHLVSIPGDSEAGDPQGIPGEARLYADFKKADRIFLTSFGSS